MTPPIYPTSPPSTSPPSNSRLGWVVAGILAAVLLGSATLWFVGPRHPAAAPPVIVTVTVPATTVTVGVPTVAPTDDMQSTTDTPAGTYNIYSLLPSTWIIHGAFSVTVGDVGSDAGGQYAVILGVKMRVGEIHYFEGIGTIKLLGASPNPCLPESGPQMCTGGSGAQAQVEYQPD